MGCEIGDLSQSVLHRVNLLGLRRQPHFGKDRVIPRMVADLMPLVQDSPDNLLVVFGMDPYEKESGVNPLRFEQIKELARVITRTIVDC